MMNVALAQGTHVEPPSQQYRHVSHATPADDVQMSHPELTAHSVGSRGSVPAATASPVIVDDAPLLRSLDEALLSPNLFTPDSYSDPQFTYSLTTEEERQWPLANAQEAYHLKYFCTELSSWVRIRSCPGYLIGKLTRFCWLVRLL